LIILFRWLHILAAITAVGGTFFMRWALLPTVAELPDAEQQAVHAGIRARWAIPVHASIAFLLLSGFYNFIFWSLPRHPGDGLYHGLFGVKFLLALAIFFIATMLIGRSPAAERFRQNRRLWLTVNVWLAIGVVCISGVLRFLPPTERGPDSAPVPTAEYRADR
jgi:uncharacterized membrane protein